MVINTVDLIYCSFLYHKFVKLNSLRDVLTCKLLDFNSSQIQSYELLCCAFDHIWVYT